MTHGGNVWQGAGPETWLDFSANLRPEGMPEWVRETLERAVRDARYYPDIAMKAAREGLAAYAGVDPARILPTAGGMSALEHALMLESGRVCVRTPAFGEYSSRARALNREVFESVDKCRPGDTAIVCNPNNPTGGALTRSEIMNAYSRMQSQGAALIVDEAFIDYCPAHSVRREVRDQLRVAGSLTKILCIPGVRLGYLCASEGEISKLERLLLPWELNAFAAAIAAALSGHLDDIRRFERENRARRERFADRLKAMGVNVLPSEANFLLCDFGRDMTDASARLKSKSILVRSCGSFGLGSNWLRLAVRTDEENDRLIGELKQCLEH